MSNPTQMSKARLAPQERRAKLLGDDDTGIDRDIEAVIGLLRERHGYSSEKATAELVRRLSFAA